MDQRLRRACLHCGADISRLSARAKYCKASCRSAAWTAEDRRRNPEKYRERDRQQAIKYAEKKRAAAAAWRKANPEWHKANLAAWRANNWERTLELNRLSVARDIGKARMHARTSGLKGSGHTPPWLTSEHRLEMAAFFREARRLTRETGIKHEVDHIEPLNGPASCGLHVPWNLQVLTMKENKSKGNKVPDALPACVSGLEGANPDAPSDLGKITADSSSGVIESVGRPLHRA